MAVSSPISIIDTSSHARIGRPDPTLPTTFTRSWDNKTRTYVYYDPNGQVTQTHPAPPNRRVNTSSVKIPAALKAVSSQVGGTLNATNKKKDCDPVKPVPTFKPLPTDVQILTDPTVTPPWSKYFDTLLRQYYYYNSTTGETVWIHPFLPRAPVPGELKYGDAGLPSNWEKYLESSVNTYFYYDPSTGESSWNHPNPPPFPSDDAQPIIKSDSNSPYVMYRDPTNNNLYFFNTRTTETFWVLPNPS
jgi:hypothetical protein